MSAETVKKIKAAAKPRKTVARTKPTAKIAIPTHEEIAMLAQRYWAERGWANGSPEQDWLRAERELSQMA